MSTEHETAVSAILEAAGVKVECRYAGETKRAFNGDHTMDRWAFRLYKGATVGEEMDYFTGLGHRQIPKLLKWRMSESKPVQPHVAGLLYSMLMDGEACHMSFADWCGEFGYDTDSRKALSTYEACQTLGDKLKRLFTRDQIEALRTALEDY